MRLDKISMEVCRMIYAVKNSCSVIFAGFQDLPGLSTKHYVTLSIVRRYLDFKVELLLTEKRK